MIKPWFEKLLCKGDLDSDTYQTSDDHIRQYLYHTEMCNLILWGGLTLHSPDNSQFNEFTEKNHK